MMTNYSDNGFLGYCVLKSDLKQDSLSIGRFFEDGSCRYEFTMEWSVLGSDNAPQLKVFDDAWSGLCTENQALLKCLAENNGKNLQIDQMIELLKCLGYRAK